MKVEVNSIKEEGLTHEENIEASSWDLDSKDVKFVKDISLSCEFRRIKNEILVKSVVNTYRQLTCSRCLETKVRQVVQQIYLSYDVKKLGQFLELDDDIREEIILNWPMKPLCKDDCRGICSGCGNNLNITSCACKK